MKNFVNFFSLLFAVLFFISCGESAAKGARSDSDLSDADLSDSDLSDADLIEGSDAENGEFGDEGDEFDDDFQSDSDSESGVSDEDGGPSRPVIAEPSAAYQNSTEAIVITTEEFAEIFNKFAEFHTVSGIITKVATLESICQNLPCDDDDALNDTPKAVKDFLISIEGLRYVVLGGDVEAVPSRKVHDSYSILGPLTTSFEEDFYTDFYYADFSDWDSNRNGIYAEEGDKAMNLNADVAVGRISVSTVEEASLYLEKAIRHSTDYDMSRVKKSLLIANIAATISNIDINAGYYFEAEGKTLDIIPPDFSVRKLYTKTIPYPGKGAEHLTNELEKSAIEEGANLIVHNGHGSPSILTCEQIGNDNDFTGEIAYQLENDVLPFFLSCACEAGRFEAPFKNFGTDSAGEMLMNAPFGGAIVYLGNTTTGLGIAGGSQFVDEMLKNIFASPYSVIGDSYLYAHANLPKFDLFTLPVSIPPNASPPSIPVVNEDSWAWTKKSVVMLGDPTITFWRDAFEPLRGEIILTKEDVDGGKKITFTIPENFAGYDMKLFFGNNLYEIFSIPSGELEAIFQEDGDEIAIGIKAEDRQYFFQKSKFR